MKRKDLWWFKDGYGLGKEGYGLGKEGYGLGKEGCDNGD